MTTHLLFIYNANSGAAQTLFGMAHKLLRPDTYACNLCSLTHGVFNENKTWKAFREDPTHDIHIDFFHKDEYLQQHPNADLNYPIILRTQNPNTHQDPQPSIFLSTSTIESCTTAEDLIHAIRTALETQLNPLD